jgi:ABC-2 type transport system ATP-binding protein
MLDVLNLRKEYKNVIAVDNISFRIEPGTIFGLLGPNGAGKTTTIRTILDIIKPTTGEIRYNGESITSGFQNLTGYLPEERGLYKKSKVVDIITYFAALKSLPHQKAIKLIDEWLEKLDIKQYRNKKIEELSKGNQQKIQFIISVIHDPQVLILDEPFTGFDPINQQLIKDLILSFVKTGRIVMLSTHQMDIAEKMCNHIFLINNGKEVLSGNINDVKRKGGTQIIHIDFEGDISFLSESSNVTQLNIFQNHAEIELNKDINPSLFLKELVDKIDIKNFSVVEPTLNNIFIDEIKRTSK